MKVTELNKSPWMSISGFVLVAMLTVGAVVPLDTAPSHFLSSNKEALMLLFLIAGFVGLVVRNNAAILVNFLACITLCSFLKASHTENFAINHTDEISIRVAHLVLEDEASLSAFGRDFNSLDADFLSIQTPIQPTLEKQLTEDLSRALPYWKKTVCDNDMTMFVFSSYELRDLDTLYCRDNNTVSLAGSMFIDDAHEEISFLSTRVPSGAMTSTHKHLSSLSSYINNNCQDRPLLTLSDTKLGATTSEVQAFKAAHRLKASRTGKKLHTDEHIFYSKDLICTTFSEIFDGNGVIATYQFKKSKKKPAFYSSAASSVKGTSL